MRQKNVRHHSDILLGTLNVLFLQETLYSQVTSTSKTLFTFCSSEEHIWTVSAYLYGRMTNQLQWLDKRRWEVIRDKCDTLQSTGQQILKGSVKFAFSSAFTFHSCAFWFWLMNRCWFPECSPGPCAKCPSSSCSIACQYCFMLLKIVQT